MKIYLLNDTSMQHAGCKATMDALNDALVDHEVIYRQPVGMYKINEKALAECRWIVVNGEGTMHHDSGGQRFLMKALEEGQRVGKKTMLINSVWEKNKNTYDNVFKKIKFVSFREKISQMASPERVGVVYPDLAFNNEYVYDAKNSIQKIWKGNIFGGLAWSDIMDKYEYRQVVLNGTFQELINKMSSCKLYITGQYHGVILAIMSGTPFVPISANTHKIEGLLQTARCPVKVCRSAQEVNEGIEYALHNPQVFEALREYYMKAPKLDKDVLNGVIC